MKRAILVFLGLIALPCWLEAQSFYAIRKERSLILVAGTGTSSYLGELSIPGDYLDAKLNINAGAQLYLSRRISIRTELTWFTLSGSDEQYGTTGRNANRKLSFKSSNFEFNAVGVFDLFPHGSRYYRRPGVNFYGFAGLGLMYFNPKADYKGETYVLQPLQTEGVAYSRITPVIPIGGGVRFRMGPNMNVSIEGGFRKTFTDYLDDVSSVYPATFLSQTSQDLSYRDADFAAPGRQRGNPSTDDAYWLLNVKIEYYLPVDLGNSSRGRSYTKSRRNSMYRYKSGGGLKR